MRKTVILSLLCALFLIPSNDSGATVTSTVSLVDCVGSGGSTCTVTYPFLATSDLVVQYWNTASCGTGTYDTYTENTDYTVTRVGITGGTVVTTVPIASGYCLRVYRLMDVTQPTSFKSQGRFSPRTHENAFDRITMIAQQIISGAEADGVSQVDFNAHLAASDAHDDHFLLVGRSGSQIAYGGTEANEDLTLRSTINADRGHIFLGNTVTVDEDANTVGINDNTPDYALDVVGDIEVSGSVGGVSQSGADLILESALGFNNGDIMFGTSCYEEDENQLGIGTCSPTSELHVVGDGYVTGALACDGLVAGGILGGDDITISSTTHATKGKIYLGSPEESAFVETAGINQLGINTVSPTPGQALHVVGEATVDTLLVDGGGIGVVSGADSPGANLFLVSNRNDFLGVISFGYIADGVLNDATGDWGFGVASPVYRMDIADPLPAGPVMQMKADGNAIASEGIHIWAGLDAAGSNSDIVWMRFYDGNGDVEWGTLEYIHGTGAVLTASSDRRLKKNIKPTDVQGLKIVNEIPLRQFDRTDTVMHDDIGFIAQEVKEVYPEMVTKDRDSGYYRVAPAAMIPVSLKAIQELSAQMEAMQAEINELHLQCGR